jgi:U2-associated protein SR140
LLSHRRIQVKVMWPRTDASVGPGADMNASRRNKSSGLSGFVAYMRRKDAETALRELDGFSWAGSLLRVGWSKAVPIPARPMYGMFHELDTRVITVRLKTEVLLVNPAAHSSSEKDSYGGSSSRRRSRSRSRDRDYDRHDRRSRRSRSRSPRHSDRDRERRRSRSRSYERSHRSKRSRSRSPRRRSRSHSPSGDQDEENLGEQISDEFIRIVASQVKGNDAAYEQSLLDREKTNPRYAFFHRSVCTHLYLP